MTETIARALGTTGTFPDCPEADGPLRFELPPELEAGEPPEARGLRRDEVRLMVSYLEDDRVVHSSFADLPEFLQAGDTLVINTSGTMNAAIPALQGNGTPLTVHLSTRLPADLWVVELRSSSGDKPVLDGKPGEVLTLPEGARLVLQTPYLAENRKQAWGPNRLWISTLNLPVNLDEYLERYGSPIRYRYVRESWPASYYQTVYATEVGSAEMPSAGRAFTPELITRLVAKGVQIVPLVLHTGVASLEDDEPPYEEFYRVPPETAGAVNAARKAGRRIVAVGTTVVRALETVTSGDGVTYPGEGWTDLYITPVRGIRSVNAMLTGLHEPRSTHLSMLEALVGQASVSPPADTGRSHLEIAYSEALDRGYLWHEFGDLHLIL
ncbi:S-adenosylmethionine:tRNA ribosyltransferase-isomerase-like protein [uncultured Rubrobacteraceae bacterium]|uniref:S-adenosylmethionine:tRNA ribosyltransferase-isomerase-like protein n=1 Tax=uncultured Rubrobacteraceae bacterium TaxID=349277 RepID=A0A6J4NZ41_9ACTN|nr:S-adenosylmethionine:tRNA ribosyltransferase-isomerase-like protein [uncultured Rubrobacteraceae bacterium]